MAKKKSAPKTKATAKKKAAPKKKSAPKKSPATRNSSTLGDLYNQVAARADTQGVKLNAAETRRVLACFFDVLEDYKPAEAFDYVAKGLKQAGGRRR